MTSESTEDQKIKAKLHRQKKLSTIRKLLAWISAVGTILSFTGIIKPSNTYIRCDDPSLMHQLNEDTISLATLLIVSLLGPLLTMLIVEWVCHHKEQVPSPFQHGAKKAYSFFLSFLVGAVFILFIVEILKTAVSEPRPHFIASCSPNLTQQVCQNTWIHITLEDCNNPLNLSNSRLMDSMKSFPSGHAAIAVFSAIYIIMYIQRRLKVSWSSLLVAWVQMVWWTWAIMCCVSRITDERHHWWDVVAGAILGVAAGYSTMVFLCHRFEEKGEEPDRERLRSERDRESPAPTSLKEENGHFIRPALEMEETSSNHQRLLVE